MSEREAARLGVTERPPSDLVKWKNPRTGDEVEIDRGLDPSWAGNPGRDRPRLLAALLAGKIDILGELSEAVAREEVGRIASSPLLERQFSPAAGEQPGDLPIAYLSRNRRDLMGWSQRVAVLTPKTAQKQGKHHRPNPDYPDDIPLTLDDYRTLLPEILERARDEHVVRSSGHWGAKRDDLLLVYEKRGLWHKAVIGKDEGAEAVRLVTFHNLSQEEAMEALKAARRRASKRKGMPGSGASLEAPGGLL